MSSGMTLAPSRFECTDDATDDLIFTVQAFDLECSTVEIKTVVTPESWEEISKLVLKALRQIHPPAA